MKIITVSREFGSGGRELGKRLADVLGFAYYDHEIITAIAKKCSMDESYIKRVVEKGVQNQFPVTFSRTFSRMPSIPKTTTTLLVQQNKVIKELASKGNCVIIGQGADVALLNYHPFKIFVYADLTSRKARCRDRAAADEKLTDRELEQKIRQVDKARAAHYKLVASSTWGDMCNYNLCINTTDTNIKAIIHAIADCASTWFEGKRI